MGCSDCFLVSYLFRTTGQVLGVSLSGALVQAVLVSSLRKGIQGPGADEVGARYSVNLILANSPSTQIDHSKYQVGITIKLATIALTQSARHSTAIIPTLEPHLREVAVQAYQRALTAVFACQGVVSFIALLCCLPIEENPLPLVYFPIMEFFVF